MKDIIIDTVIDSLKLLPFLFLAFLIIELFEHKLSKKSIKLISNNKKVGPLIGSIFGLVPQCGFSVLATNLYITRIITLGTLISIYLTTSDEMIPVLIGEKASISLILRVLALKLVIGMLAGFIIDLFIRPKKEKEKYDICHDSHCGCDHSIFKSSLIHTLKTLSFIFITTFILNIGFEYLGERYLSKLLLKDSLFGPFITCLIGLIPNCGASVMITELYLNNAISFASLISGLLTGSGVALLVLFKSNKNIKENITIISLIYIIGVISGIVISLVNYL